MGAQDGIEYQPLEFPLKNAYWLLRHGRSLANEAGIIISKKHHGVSPEYRLAAAGRAQAVDAGKQLAEQLAGLPPAPLYFVLSPFSRTLETATLAGAQVGITPDPPHFQTADELVERDFGTDNEKQPYHGRYEAIWEVDAHDAHHVPGSDGESVTAVATRLTQLIRRLEAEHEGARFVLVAHGDTLSICQAVLTPSHAHDLRTHRAFPFETAQLKRVV